MSLKDIAKLVLEISGELYVKYLGRQKAPEYRCEICLEITDLWCRKEVADHKEEIITKLKSARQFFPKEPVHAYMLSLAYYKLAKNKQAALDQAEVFLDLTRKRNMRFYTMGETLVQDIRRLESSLA